MALYYNLAVYKSSYRLVKKLFMETENFSRQYKYTTGQQMKNEAMILIKNIYRANKEIDKVPYIQEARENLEMIRLQVRLTQDFDQLSLEVFVEINLMIEDISKQLANWENFSRKKLRDGSAMTGIEISGGLLPLTGEMKEAISSP